MISSSVAAGHSFEWSQNPSFNVPTSISSWLRAVEHAHAGLQFAVQPSAAMGSSEMVAGRAKREREFFAGRRCAAKLLAQRGVYQPVGVNSDRSPNWPEGTVGSISHSDRWTIACVGTNDLFRSVGIDTEPIMSHESARQIKNDVATKAEMNRLASSGLSETAALTLIFSAKESYYKCWYPITKRFLEFRDVEIIDATARMLFLRGVEKTSNQHSELAIEYLLTDHDVFTCTCLEGGQ